MISQILFYFKYLLGQVLLATWPPDDPFVDVKRIAIIAFSIFGVIAVVMIVLAIIFPQKRGSVNYNKNDDDWDDDGVPNWRDGDPHDSRES